jgi:hypothetical protein
LYARPTFRSGSLSRGKGYPNFSANARFSSTVSKEMPRMRTPFVS